MVTVLYKTDFNHSFNSRELIGVFTNKKQFEKATKKLITEDLKLDSGQMNHEEEKANINWNIQFFREKKQTQGLNSFELVAEVIETNKII